MFPSYFRRVVKQTCELCRCDYPSGALFQRSFCCYAAERIWFTVLKTTAIAPDCCMSLAPKCLPVTADGNVWPGRLPRLIVLTGIIIRIGVFLVLWPDNSDGHSEVIAFILNHHRLPHLLEAHEAYSPPLYYILGVPFMAAAHAKGVQLLSLGFSVGTLLVLYRLICGTAIIRSDAARLYSLILVALLPQFVIYSLFITNDTMASFLGAAVILQAYRFAASPDRKKLSLLAILTGLGLLTKGVFLAFVPILMVLVFVRSEGGRRKAALASAAYLLITAALGCYKYVDNYVMYRNPAINSMDTNPEWAVEQRKLYRGWKSYSDLNVVRLIDYPSFEDRNDWGYPVLFYASFWYPHTRESSFAQLTPSRILGSLTYLFAPVPTAAFLAGLGVFLAQLWRSGRNLPGLDAGTLTAYAAAAILLCNIALLLSVEAKYHVWSIIQGRLVFSSMFGGVAVFSEGVRIFESRRVLKMTLAATMACLTFLFLFYLCGEIAMNANAAQDTFRGALRLLHVV